MLFDIRLYRKTIFNFATRVLPSTVLAENAQFRLDFFSFEIMISNVENFQDPKLFNYFYLTRYFFGVPLSVTSCKKYFVLGKTYYNIRLSFLLNSRLLDVPLSIWIFQVQPLVNLSLTRDYVLCQSHFQWALRDPSIFSERKTNTGLFDLQDPLVFTLHYRQPTAVHSLYFTRKLITAFKFIL